MSLETEEMGEPEGGGRGMRLGCNFFSRASRKLAVTGAGKLDLEFCRLALQLIPRVFLTRGQDHEE